MWLFRQSPNPSVYLSWFSSDYSPCCFARRRVLFHFNMPCSNMLHMLVSDHSEGWTGSRAFRRSLSSKVTEFWKKKKKKTSFEKESHQGRKCQVHQRPQRRAAHWVFALGWSQVYHNWLYRILWEIVFLKSTNLPKNFYYTEAGSGEYTLWLPGTELSHKCVCVCVCVCDVKEWFLCGVI